MNKKILIWGTGGGATGLFNKYLKVEDVVGFIDNDIRRCGSNFLGKPVINPKEINEADYEIILVASTFSYDIYLQCKNLGLNMDCIFFVYRDFGKLNHLTSEKAYQKLENLIGHEWIDLFDNHFRVISENIWFRKNNSIGALENSRLKERDYIRCQTCELLADEINRNNIDGDIAELGVYRGEFSRFIRSAFNEKRELYLFDTFSSFDEDELKKETSYEKSSIN